MRFKGTKAVLGVVLCSLTVLLSGCFSKEDLREPIQHYLSSYGIEDFTIVSADNNWFEGVDHQTYIKIEKPYPTVVYLLIERGTDRIDREIKGDDVFEKLFKGAFIEQHPQVLQKSDELMKKYHLHEKSPYEHDTFYYYLDVHIKEEQKVPLIEQFKEKQELNTDNILPALVQDDPSKGVIDFTYLFNTYGHTGDVPKADSLVQDFADSRVLPEGMYNVAIMGIRLREDGSSSFGLDDNYSSVIFRVNKQGEVQVLQTIHGMEEAMKAGVSI